MSIPRKRRYPRKPIRKPAPVWQKASMWIEGSGTYIVPYPTMTTDRTRFASTQAWVYTADGWVEMA